MWHYFEFSMEVMLLCKLVPFLRIANTVRNSIEEVHWERRPHHPKMSTGNFRS